MWYVVLSLDFQELRSDFPGQLHLFNCSLEGLDLGKAKKLTYDRVLHGVPKKDWTDKGMHNVYGVCVRACVCVHACVCTQQHSHVRQHSQMARALPSYAKLLLLFPRTNYFAHVYPAEPSRLVSTGELSLSCLVVLGLL